MKTIFIWNFVAGEILDQLVDWIYGQLVGFLGNFFALMGNMGVELFELEWVDAIVLFFSRLAWALFSVSVVVCAFECGIEYSAGRGNLQQTALNIIKGFLAVSLFTVVPVRLYALSVSLQGTFSAGLTGYGRSIGEVGQDIITELSEIQSLGDVVNSSHFGLGIISSPKARWVAGAALTAADQAMASVMSTVLSKLNAFLDSELEQVICRDNPIDAERFASSKCAIFVVIPEEDPTKNFIASLMIQNLSRELFSVADENGGRLKNRVVIFADEFGTMPPFDVLPLFSAGRSRGLTLVPIIQSLAQLEKNYGKEGAEIVCDNCRATRS